MKNYYRMDTDQSNDINTIMSVAEVAEHLSVGKTESMNYLIMELLKDSEWEVHEK